MTNTLSDCRRPRWDSAAVAMVNRNRRRVNRCIALGLFGLLTAGPSLAVTDPFYADQLRHGTRSYQAGDYEAAVKLLRVAAFGLLDEPQILTETLLLLALSQAALERRTDFEETFERIVDIEERFSSYSVLDRPEVKAAFESRVAELVAVERLRVTPSFAALAARVEEQRLSALTPRQHRQRLEERLTAAPADLEALLSLLRLELGEGRLRVASRLADRAVSLQPESPEAHCARTEVAITRNDCRRIEESLTRCGRPPVSASSVERALTCLLERGQAESAAALVAALGVDLRESPSIAALARDIAAQGAEEGAAAVRSPETEAGTESMENAEPEAARDDLPAPVDSEASAPDPTPRPEVTEIEQLRAALAAARHTDELAAPRDRLAELAASYPSDRVVQHLAAEAAYRGGEWGEAVEYFHRGGAPDEGAPLLLFYYAVALFETGALEEAREALERALPLVSRTPFVIAYERRILGAGG